ncbi:MAG: hypothetical protein ABW000_22585 [Actinoplanes sp.]
MASRIARRVFAGVAAAALAVTTGALPAAADNAADVFLVTSDVLLPVKGPGVLVSPTLEASEPVTIEEARVTFRLTGITSGVTLTGDDSGPVHCTNTTPTEVVCEHSGSLDLYPGGIAGLFRVYLKALYDPRKVGSLDITFSGRGYGPVTQTIQVRPAEAVDLTAGPAQEETGSPGDRIYTQLPVRNTGTKGITGAAVVFNSGPGITTRVRHHNCFYKQGRPTACFFDKKLVWDAAYDINLQYYISRDAEAPGQTSLQPQWLTAAEFEDYQNYLSRRGLDLGQPGTDLDLPLKRTSPMTGTAALVQTDLYPDDNWTSVLITIEP